MCPAVPSRRNQIFKKERKKTQTRREMILYSLKMGWIENPDRLRWEEREEIQRKGGRGEKKEVLGLCRILGSTLENALHVGPKMGTLVRC